MNDPTGPLLSVRGDARRTVKPDYAVLSSSITVSRESKPAVLRDAAAALERLTADLTARGGVALAVETERSPLTWSAQSAATQAAGEHNKQTGLYELTGRVTRW